MNKWQIKWLAWRCYKAGPAIVEDSYGREYWAYVCFIRVGIRATMVYMDEDLVTMTGQPLKFIEAEIRAFISGMGKPIRIAA